MSDSASRDIAVIGYSCRFAAADNVDEFWKNLVEGKHGFREIPSDRWDHDLFYSEHSREHDKTYVTRGAFMDDVSSFPAMHFGIAPRRVEVMDPQQRMILEAVRIALQDAGLEKGGYDPQMVGTFLGVSTSEYRNLVTSRTMGMLITQGKMGAKTSADGDWEIGHALENIAPISAFSMPGTLLNMTAANVAHQWKLGGPAYTVDAACASSLVAVHDAITNIRAGICDMALAGGVYVNLTPESLIGFSRIGAISKSGECRPFDEKADGFLQGDGCGVLVLKRLDLARADGDRIHAVIRGTGINNDADTSGPMAPAIEGQADVIQRAYRDARVDSVDGIGYVECHGTGTAVGDPVEVSALRQIYGNDGPRVHIGSVKANVGHTMSAAGVAGLLKAILAVEHGKIPVQPGFETPHEAIELDKTRFAVARETIDWKSDGPRRAAVSAFGFGGTNCHMLIEQAPPTETTATTGWQLVVLSADNRELLAEHARDVAESARASDASLSDIAYSLSTARHYESTRLALVVESKEELVSALEDAGERLVSSSSKVLGPDAFVGEADAPKLAFMFPGQGAQRVGLLRDAYDRFEGFRNRVDSLAASVESEFDRPLTHYLYPDLAGEPYDLEKAEEALTATEICQPAMALLGLALAEFVRQDLGIEPSVSLGHSLGEFVAVGASGAISPEETLQFVTERGRLMAELELDDQGSMVAVMGDEKTVAEYLEGFDDIQIANLNHPQQTVVSGATDSIEKLASELESKKVKATILRVSHAFHSPIVEGISDNLRRAAEKLEFGEGHSTAISAIDVGPYENHSLETFVRHATAPVNFIGALQAAREAGADYFLEVGAGTTLTRCATKTLDDVECRTLGNTERDENREFLRTLAHLVVSGAAIDTHGLMNTTDRPRLVSLPATRLETQSYWVVRDREMPMAIAEEAEERRQNKNGETMSNDLTPTNDGLVALFQQQNEILRQHAQIMAAQTALLNGENVDLDALQGAVEAGQIRVDAPSATAPRTASAPAEPESPEEAPEPSAQPEVESVAHSDIVYAAVADVSAFPIDALKDEQQLAADLGFDSLMFVDLASALQKAIPGLGEIPQDAFNQKTTIGEVIAWLNDNVSNASEVIEDEEEAEISADEAIRRYAPVWVEQARPELPERAIFEDLKLVLIADEATPAGLTEALEKEGVDIVASSADAAEDALEDAGADGVLWYVGDDCDDELELYWRAHRLAATLENTSDDPRMFAILTSIGHEALVDGIAPWADGLGAFAQSLAREWTSTRIKYIDTTSHFEEAVRELRTPAKDVSAHYVGTTRWVAGLEERPFAKSGFEFASDDVIVVTGGSKGIGALLSTKLAEKSGAKFVIVGRTAKDSLDDEAQNNLDKIRAHASGMVYVSWDVSEPAPEALQQAFDELGAPTALIHSAGVIRDREVHSKVQNDVETVTAVKTVGFDHVYEAVAVASDNLRLVLGFTSWAGIFGNRSQTDYAAANAALDARMRALRGAGVHAASIAWPAWESSEMVQSIPAPVRNAMRAKGVTFISDQAGVQAFFDELSTADETTTAVYGVNLPTEIRAVRTRFTVSLDSHPYLKDHVLKEKPVMPFASALDYVATAGLQTLGETPPFAIEDFALHRGIDADKPVTLQLSAEGESRGRRHEAKIEVKALVEGQPESFAAYGARFVTGTIEELMQLVPESKETQKGPDPRMSLERFYDEFAFHGPSLQAIEEIEELGDSHIVGRMRTSTPADLLNDPVREAWTVDPRVIDGAMQLTLYYLQSRHGMAAFPTGFSSYVQLRPIVEDEVRVTLVKHELTDSRVVGSLRVETLDGEPIAVMSRLTARVFEFAKKLEAPEEEGPEVAEEHWNVSKFPEVEALEQRLQMADLMGIANPYFAVHDGVAKNKAVINGKEMINFSSYNYLGFSGHPEVSKAAKDAVDRYGTSVSASRLASGQIPLHGELEETISKFLGVEAALVFSAGHHTNESVIGHLFNEGDLIIHDSLAHNSILTGAELSGAKRMKFPHNDHVALEKLLKQLRGSYNKVGIMIEGVYSMDGDIPDLPAFIALKKKYKCLLYVDEAHSAGCIGPRGAGVADHFGLDPMEVDVWMGTLSKSFSSCGGYCAGSEQLIQYLKYTVPGFIFSAGISPANAAAALAAVKLLAENPEVPRRLQARSEFFLNRCKELGLDTGPSGDSAVVPVIVGNSMECLQLSEALAKRGINVQPIVYPAVDDDAARLRFFMSATHEEDELEFTADTIAEELNRIQSGAAAE